MTPNNAETLRFSAYGDSKQKISPVHWLYFPTHFDQYITICIENEYKLWNEVFEMILSPLMENGIGIISVAKGREKTIKFGQSTNGISMGGAAYLIENALCHVCAVDWTLNLAHHNGIKPVFVKTLPIYHAYDSELYADGVDETDKPEVLARAILARLGIEHKIRVDTLFMGDAYGENFIELIPDFAIKDANINPSMNIGVRCDLIENWEFVKTLIGKGVKPTIISNSVPPVPILPFIKQINKINIWVNEETQAEDIKRLEDLGIPYTLLSKTDDIADIKYRLFDCTPIKVISGPSKNILDKLKEMPYDTRIKSKRLVVSKAGTFLSVFHWKQGLTPQHPKGSLLLGGAEDETFLSESDLFIYYKLTHE